VIIMGRLRLNLQGCGVLIAVVAVGLTTARLTWEKPPGQVIFFVSHTILPPAVLPYLVALALGGPRRESFRGVALFIGIPASVIALLSFLLWVLVDGAMPSVSVGFLFDGRRLTSAI
jgi:hypothetical protein